MHKHKNKSRTLSKSSIGLESGQSKEAASVLRTESEAPRLITTGPGSVFKPTSDLTVRGLNQW